MIRPRNRRQSRRPVALSAATDAPDRPFVERRRGGDRSRLRALKDFLSRADGQAERRTATSAAAPIEQPKWLLWRAFDDPLFPRKMMETTGRRRGSPEGGGRSTASGS